MPLVNFYRFRLLWWSHPDPLHLIEAHFLAPPIVELRRSRAGMVRHLRRLLQRAAVLQIRRDPGCPEAVIAKLGRDAGRRRASADHCIGVGLGQRRARQQPGAAADRAKQRPLGIFGDACAVNISGKVGLKVVVARHGVGLSAFLAQPDP
jgi:hypothetical protein